MLSLRDHISELVTYKSKKGKSDRNLKIALSYFGFGEKGYYTEETLGKEHKITRSRIQQIFNEKLLEKKTAKLTLPSIEETNQIIENALNLNNGYILYSELAPLLTKSIGTEYLHPFGLFNLSQYFNFNPNFSVVKIETSEEENFLNQGEHIIARQELHEKLKEDFQDLLKLPGRKGRAGIFCLNHLFQAKNNYVFNFDETKKLLRGRNDVWCYEEETGRFWYLVEFGDKRGNPVITILRKIKGASKDHLFEKNLLVNVIETSLSRRGAKEERESMFPSQKIIKQYLDESQFIDQQESKFLINDKLQSFDLEPIEQDLTEYLKNRSICTQEDISKHLQGLEKNYTEENIRMLCNFSPLLKEIENIPKKRGKDREFVFIAKFNNDDLYLTNAIEDAVQGGNKGLRELWKRGKKFSQENFKQALDDFKHTGDIGEQLIYDYLCQQKRLKVEWVSKDYPFAPYDLIITDIQNSRTYIDVKSTNGNFDNTIHISYNELQAMQDLDVYQIYRVYEISDNEAFFQKSEDLKEFSSEVIKIFSKLPEQILPKGISLPPNILKFSNEIRIPINSTSKISANNV